MNLAAIETRDLSVTYGNGDAALQNVDLRVERGEVVGLLGPNGSGKSTLFRVLATLLPPTNGTAGIFGADVATDRNGVRRRLAVLFQQPALDRELTSRENLACHGRLYGLQRRTIAERTATLLTQVGLLDRADEPIRRFSGGMRRRVEIAKCLLCEPPLLLMDEPTVGLDPTARREVWDLLARLRAGRDMTVLVATHLLDEATRCDRLILLDRGHVVAQGTPEGLVESLGFELAILVPRDPADLEALRQGVAEQIALEPGALRPAGPPQAHLAIRTEDAHELVEQLLRQREELPPLQEISMRRPTLEDVFEYYTGRSLDDA